MIVEILVGFNKGWTGVVVIDRSNDTITLPNNSNWLDGTHFYGKYEYKILSEKGD
jgi:hypothetical protein